jgi:hypothetical protein
MVLSMNCKNKGFLLSFVSLSKKTLLLQAKAISPNTNENTTSNIEIGSISNRYGDNHPDMERCPFWCDDCGGFMVADDTRHYPIHRVFLHGIASA